MHLDEMGMTSTVETSSERHVLVEITTDVAVIQRLKLQAKQSKVRHNLNVFEWSCCVYSKSIDILMPFASTPYYKL